MKKHISILFAFALLLPCHTLKSQNQANVWYFGNYAGLDFNYGTVTPLTDGQVVSENPTDAISEGTTGVSDTAGNLLFYSNGVSVWNRRHRKMPNGTGLAGNNSTSQTLAVPHPANENLYYVFSASPQGDIAPDTAKSGLRYNQKIPGFWYSIIDLSADNGLGDVTVKNVRLHGSTTEKMCATLHANGEDIWVVMHEWNSDAFRAYRLTSNTFMVDTNAVVSRTGAIHTGGGMFADDQGQLYSGEINAIGQMKFSLDGTRIALALRDTSLVEVFAFNKSTGTIAHQFTLSNALVPYGVEFSPGGRFLYIGARAPRTQIIQYDLQGQNIERSSYSLSEAGIANPGNLQLAPDHKIYIASGDQIYLQVINSPDSLGKSCGYLPQGFDLQGKACSIGLPNFPTFFLAYPDPIMDIPNVFTPNQDGYNEVFTPIRTKFVAAATTLIHNRWGEEVYRTRNPYIHWKGDNSPAGVYYWQMEYEGKNKKKYVQKGMVSLLR